MVSACRLRTRHTVHVGWLVVEDSESAHIHQQIDQREWYWAGESTWWDQSIV